MTEYCLVVDLSEYTPEATRDLKDLLCQLIKFIQECWDNMDAERDFTLMAFGEEFVQAIKSSMDIVFILDVGVKIYMAWENTKEAFRVKNKYSIYQVLFDKFTIQNQQLLSRIEQFTGEKLNE